MTGKFYTNSIVFAATLLAGSLAFYELGTNSLWLDEAYSVGFAKDWPSLWLANLTLGGNAWLYYTILHPWLIFGNDEAVIRSLSAIFAVLSIPFLYFLGLFSQQADKDIFGFTVE